MPSFGKRSTSYLSTCHPDLRRLFRFVVEHYDCAVICGRRSRAAQDEAFHNGASEVEWPYSNHNVVDKDGNEIALGDGGYSNAVDVVPWFAERPHVRWNDQRSFDHFTGYVLGVAKSMGIPIRSGHDWDSDHDLRDQKFIDSPHFEMLDG